MSNCPLKKSRPKKGRAGPNRVAADCPGETVLGVDKKYWLSQPFRSVPDGSRVVWTWRRTQPPERKAPSSAVTTVATFKKAKKAKKERKPILFDYFRKRSPDRLSDLRRIIQDEINRTWRHFAPPADLSKSYDMYRMVKYFIETCMELWNHDRWIRRVAGTSIHHRERPGFVFVTLNKESKHFNAHNLNDFLELVAKEICMALRSKFRAKYTEYVDAWALLIDRYKVDPQRHWDVIGEYTGISEYFAKFRDGDEVMTTTTELNWSAIQERAAKPNKPSAFDEGVQSMRVELSKEIKGVLPTLEKKEVDFSKCKKLHQITVSTEHQCRKLLKDNNKGDTHIADLVAFEILKAIHALSTNPKQCIKALRLNLHPDKCPAIADLNPGLLLEALAENRKTTAREIDSKLLDLWVQ